MQVRDIELKNKVAQGIEISLQNSTLVMAVGSKGYIMCGYLNTKTAEKFGDCAAVVKGVKSVDDLLDAKIVEVTKSAQKRGIKVGMKAIKALEKLV